MIAARVALGALLSLAGCTCDEPALRGMPPAPEAPEAPEEVAAEEPLTLESLFPIHVGDRWGFVRVSPPTPNQEEAPPAQVRGFVAPLPASGGGQGGATFFGTDRVSAMRLRHHEEGVQLLDDQNQVVGLWLSARIAEGEAWEYAIARGRCSARYTRLGSAMQVAGQRLTRCASVERQCRYEEPPIAGLLETRQELYCPGVGLVRQQTTLDPAPAELPAQTLEALDFYRVQDAPIAHLTSPLQCTQLLLMPSDLQAACGSAAQLQAASPQAHETCAFADEAMGVRIAIAEAEEALDAETTRARAQAILGRELDEFEFPTGAGAAHERHYHFTAQGNFLWIVSTPQSPEAPQCSADQAARLLPLLRSLVTT